MNPAPDLHAATRHTLDLCARIATHTDVHGTITRLFLSPATREVHTFLLAEMHALGMATHTDSLGNLHGLYPPSTSSFWSEAPESPYLPLPIPTPTLLLGSHIDTVPNAGPYDGILGVALPLALLAQLHATGTRLPYPIHLIAFSEEEGIRFQLPFLGSRHVTGTLPPEALQRTDAAGITLAQALLSFQGETEEPASPLLSPQGEAQEPASRLPRPAAFLELHIEQGPVLDSLNLPLGVVTTISGQSRYQLTFTGQANHAGTTPMHLRQDALAAAAQFIALAESHALAHPPLVATVGTIAVTPAAANVIPGTCTLSLDLRHPEDPAREAAATHLLAEANRIAAERSITLTTHQTSSQPSVPMHPALQQLLAQSVVTAGHTAYFLPSGAGHDAMILATARIPTTMLFLRSPGGLSHHPDESVLPADVHAALATLWHFLQNFHPEQLP